MSGICDTCQRLKRIGCGLTMDGLKSCDLHENENRYDKLFGTPERAARTITQMQMSTDLMGCCDAQTCPAAFEECWKLDSCPMDDYDLLLEWLEGEGDV